MCLEIGDSDQVGHERLYRSIAVIITIYIITRNRYMTTVTAVIVYNIGTRFINGNAVVERITVDRILPLQNLT